MLTHHAYYIEDSFSTLDDYAENIRAHEGFELGDPNFSIHRFDKFGIDESRAFIELTSLKNTGEKALFVIGVGTITTEAQQALLKLFEEPQRGTVFVLLVPQGSMLPTLRSRFLEYPKTRTSDVLVFKASDTVREFLNWPYKKRSDWIAATLKDDDARDTVRTFLNSLEQHLHPMIAKNKEVRDTLSYIAHFRVYLNDKGPSLKMILEHFAATLPNL